MLQVSSLGRNWMSLSVHVQAHIDSRTVVTHPAVQFGHLKFKCPAGWSTEAWMCTVMVQQLSAYQCDVGGARRGVKCNIRACFWSNSCYLCNYLCNILIAKVICEVGMQHFNCLVYIVSTEKKSEDRHRSRHGTFKFLVCALLQQVFLCYIRCWSPPCLTVSINVLDKPSVLGQQLASSFLLSAVPPAQRLDTATQRVQYLWGLLRHVSHSLSIWVKPATAFKQKVFWRFQSLCIQNGLKFSFMKENTQTWSER